MTIGVSFLQYILQGCFPGLLSALFLITFILLDRTFSPKVLKFFFLAILFTMILCISDCIDLYLLQNQINLPLRKFLSAVCFTSRVCSVGFTVAITQRNSSKTGFFVYIAMIFNAIVSFISIPTGCIFNFTPDHAWHMGPLFFIPYVCTAYYVVLLLISSFKKFYSNFGEAIIIIGIFILSLFANMLEIFAAYKMLLVNAFLLGIDFYFLCLNVQLYRRDPLTNLLNRRSFYMTATSHFSNHLTVLSLDLNNLKTLNDEEGHAAGDLALITVGENLTSTFKKHGSVYRLGGDEFMVLFIEKKEKEIENLVELFNQNLSRTRYSVACGTADFIPGDNFDKVVEAADLKMYENKRLMKGREAR